MAILFASTMNATSFEFSGEVKQEGNQSVIVAVYAPDGTVEVVECSQEKKLFGTKTTFSLTLEEDSYYTLYFETIDYDKMVYVDTHDIRSFDTYQCHVADMDVVIYYDPVDGYPHVTYMDVGYLNFVCENFPVMRNYNPQLEELKEDTVYCPKAKNLNRNSMK